MGIAFQQPGPDLLLELPNLFAQRWLRDAEPLRRAAETEFFRNRNEIPGMTQFHITVWLVIGMAYDGKKFKRFLIRPIWAHDTAMDLPTSPGARLRAAIEAEHPLQVVGTINAYCALLAERAGFRALYLSGAGVANASFGLPDLGITTLNDVCEDIRRITQATSLPLLVDADTGWGGAFMIARTIREFSRAGAAGCHLEDQVQAKRCGHRPGKELVSTAEMCDRIKAAVDARTDASFVIMARTDAHANEGLEAAIARSQAYVAAGADMIFAEALASLDEFRKFTTALGPVPVLANITEFGKTPQFTVEELDQSGVRLVLYPLSAFRAMNKAAEAVYQALRTKGTQRDVVATMQTRAELYDVLNYHAYEAKLDALFAEQKKKQNP
jgi:methylisocitrate lyase